MNGYGSHTFSFINAKNGRFWVKFHFKVQQGIRFHTNWEAEQIAAKTRESFQRGPVWLDREGRFPESCSSR